MILFKTHRLVVKRFTDKDADLFFQVNGSPEVMQHIRPAKSRKESDEFLQDNIRFYRDDSLLGRYAVFTRRGNFVGTFSYLYLSGEADFHIGYALVPSAWNRGYATELVRAGVPYFFAHTPYPSLFAITIAENTASQKVLLKAGFVYKGQSGEGSHPLELFYINRNLDGNGQIEQV